MISLAQENHGDVTSEEAQEVKALLDESVPSDEKDMRGMFGGDPSRPDVVVRDSLDETYAR